MGKEKANGSTNKLITINGSRGNSSRKKKTNTGGTNSMANERGRKNGKNNDRGVGGRV